MENNFLAGLVAGIVGLMAFLAIPSTLGWTPFMLILALIAGLAVALFSFHYIRVLIESFIDSQDVSQTPIRRGKDDFSALSQVVGLDVKEFKKAITDAREKLNLIYNTVWDELNPSEIRTHIKNIVETGHLVLDEIVADPADFNTARSWVNVYLDQTSKIVSNYFMIRSKWKTLEDAKLSAPFMMVRQETQETLQEIEVNFKNLLERLHANDIKALQVDMEVLREQLKTERN